MSATQIAKRLFRLPGGIMDDSGVKENRFKALSASHRAYPLKAPDVQVNRRSPHVEVKTLNIRRPGLKEHE